jgi:hypothetical protein
MKEEISKDFVKMYTEFSGAFNKNLSEEELNDVATLLWLECSKNALEKTARECRTIISHGGHVRINETSQTIENRRLEEIGKFYESMLIVGNLKKEDET